LIRAEKDVLGSCPGHCGKGHERAFDWFRIGYARVQLARPSPVDQRPKLLGQHVTLDNLLGLLGAQPTAQFFGF
jgi:hypothetical protein